MKPVTAFWRYAVSRDGRDGWCSHCRLSYIHKWYIENRDRYNAHHRAYYREHRERLRAYNREYQRRRRELMRSGEWTGRRRAG